MSPLDPWSCYAHGNKLSQANGLKPVTGVRGANRSGPEFPRKMELDTITQISSWSSTDSAAAAVLKSYSLSWLGSATSTSYSA